MSEYTVRSGENLWNICKNQFNLKSNAEIAKKVKEIAATNSIANANNIQIGQKLKLGDTTAGNGKEYSKEVTQAVTDKINFNNIQTYNDLKTQEQSSVSIFGSNIKTDAQKNGAYTDYSEKLLLDYYDSNHDGTVTVEEFAEKELAMSEKSDAITHDKLNADAVAMGGEAMPRSDEEKAQNTIQNQRSSNLFAQNLDINGNGKIDANELAFFNKMADERDGEKDGVIYASGEAQMFMSVTGQNAANPEYNAVINKYLMGQTLTPEEEATLKEAQKTIRTSMGKASGINIEG